MLARTYAPDLQVCDWGVTESGDSRERIELFKKLNSEKSIAVVLMSLSGTVEHTKTHVAGHLEKFAKYSWLWTQVQYEIADLYDVQPIRSGMIDKCRLPLFCVVFDRFVFALPYR